MKSTWMLFAGGAVFVIAVFTCAVIEGANRADLNVDEPARVAAAR